MILRRTLAAGALLAAAAGVALFLSLPSRRDEPEPSGEGRIRASNVAPVARVSDSAPPAADHDSARAAEGSTPLERVFRGSVLTAARAPVAGVRVRLAILAADRDPDATGDSIVEWFDGSRLRVVARAQTGPDGRFSLDAAGFDAAARPAFLVADAPPGLVPERVADPPMGVDVEIVLHEGGVVTGVVRAEETGDPVPEVSVRIRSVVVSSSGIESDEDEVRTDRDGRYAVDQFVGRPVEFATRYGLDPEWRIFPVEMPDLGPGETVEVPLTISIRPYFEGRVLEALSREPIAGAYVELSGPYSRDAFTGADGRFVLAHVEPRPGEVSPAWFERGARRRLTATARGYLAAERIVAPADPSLPPIEIALSRGIAVEGIAVLPGGKPVAAHVEIGFRGRVVSAAASGADGRFRFESVPPLPSGATLAARTFRREGARTLRDLDLSRDLAGLVVTLDDPLSGRIDAVGVERIFPLASLERIDHPAPMTYFSKGERLEDGALSVVGLEAGEYIVKGLVGDEGRYVRVTLPPGGSVGPVDVASGARYGEGRSAIAFRVTGPDGFPVEDVAVGAAPDARVLSVSKAPWLLLEPGSFELDAPAGEVVLTVKWGDDVVTRTVPETWDGCVRRLADVSVGGGEGKRR